MGTNNYIFGASGHAKVVIDILLENKISIKAIVDDTPKADMLLSIPVIPTAKFEPIEGICFIIAIGNNAIRKKIVAKNTFTFFNVIHNNATISKFADLGIGIVVMPNSVINADATIGNHCIINSNAVVEHDCVLEDYVHISPSAALAGNVFVGEGTQVGIGACVIQGVKIGKWATIGAGAVIIDDVPDYAVVVGNPGKVIKYNCDGL